MNDTLITRDSLGKIRIIFISCEWSEKLNAYIISRQTGLYNGKLIDQPLIEINRGKVKRTIKEQAELEYNSNRKKYLDKGYKSIKEFGYDNLTQFNPDEILPTDEVTNSNGVIKPMLAKPYQDVSTNALNKEYFCSRKINGTRALIFQQNSERFAASRGSMFYNEAVDHILNHPKLINFFDKHPDIILDGEIYKHGESLNNISGIVRKQEITEESNKLEFYLYDIVDTRMPFSERYKILKDIEIELELEFDPIKEWDKNDLKIQFVPHIILSGWSSLKKYHDIYVNEGWEGIIARTLTDVYKPGKRGGHMLKIKDYFDAEYKIIGLVDGLREEDMCFLMETPNGNQFKAKPIGNRALKQWYQENINDIIGKMGTVKYFEMSGAGTDIPQQPIFLRIRQEND